MEARHLLKALKDAGWYLGAADEACRQYIHADRDEVVTVAVRYTDELGPETVRAVLRHAGLEA